MALGEKPRDFKPGMRQLSPYELNRIVRTLVRQIIGTPGQINVSYFGDRVSIGLAKSEGALPLPAIRSFAVIQEFDDYLLCAPLNTGSYSNDPKANVPFPPVYNPDLGSNVPAEQLVYVAKPYILQRTPWEGTFVYPGTNSSSVWPPALDHVPGVRAYYTNPDIQAPISPAYQTGEIILAALAVTGYINPATVTSTAELSDHTNSAIVWEDLNAAGRVWGGFQLFGINGTGITSEEGVVTDIPDISITGVAGLYIDQSTGLIVGPKDDNGIASLILHEADTTHPGAMTNAQQIFAGSKGFTKCASFYIRCDDGDFAGFGLTIDTSHGFLMQSIWSSSYPNFGWEFQDSSNRILGAYNSPSGTDSLEFVFVASQTDNPGLPLGAGFMLLEAYLDSVAVMPRFGVVGFWGQDAGFVGPPKLFGRFTFGGGLYLGDSGGPSQFDYTPTSPSDWNISVPTTVAEALDRCALLLRTLNGGVGP